MRTFAKARPGRLSRRQDFLRVARYCRKAAMPGLVLQARDSDQPDLAPRVGLTASRRVGNAVSRNRARRRLRSVVQDVFADHACGATDYVVIARATTLTRSYDDLLKDLRTALYRVNQATRERL